MKITYCSDLHLEFQNYPHKQMNNDSGGDVLILAGDIVCASVLLDNKNDPTARGIKKFMTSPFKDFVEKHDHVIYVMGNHEHYGYVMQDSPLTIKNFFQKNYNVKFHLLENQFVDIGDVRFVGATLWTDYENNNPISRENFRLMNDSHVIYTRGFKTTARLTADYAYQLHVYSRHYINGTVKGDRPVVVITHHAAHPRSCGDYYHVHPQMNGCYASDLSNVILDNPNIIAWISGHTHSVTSYDIGDTKMLSQPRGYYGEKSFEYFNRFGFGKLDLS